MEKTVQFDVIIIGGSYSGLSAAMALGRALRKTLIIDGGKPCNRQTPHSHNFITHDGKAPREIADTAREQVLRYDTVSLVNDTVINVVKTDHTFTVNTHDNTYKAKKLVLATGVTDVVPAIEGFAECWGISVVHCPYCHGYEVRHQKTGIFANGPAAFEYARLISNWTKDLTLFTNGPATLGPEQRGQIAKHNIAIVETPVTRIEHQRGYIQHLILADGNHMPLKALYAGIPKGQSTSIPVDLGCELTEHGLLKVDMMQRTSVTGVYACGDNSAMARSVASAVATGNMAGAALNKEMIEETF